MVHELFNFRQLKFVDSLRDGEGFQDFSDSELEPLQRVMDMGKGLSQKRGHALCEEVKSGINAGNVDGVESNFVCRAFVRGGGPVAALKKSRLDVLDEGERLLWCEQARLDAIVGSQRLSINMLKSGLRCYFAFVSKSS